MKVKLTYFRVFGKYYSEGEYDTNQLHLFEIFEEVAKLIENRKLPGLIEGHGSYIVLVDVPEHPNNHPALVLPKLLADFTRGLWE